ncbi:CHAT domain-containing protein [Salinibacter grassmerensis]|uniref:CHAT domain-containing protein n=1 Tax=Salinibacter grassmerensis TaxID=3040353 RepID=UPI0021E94061|nr:CHAT domain-containing tetratricopeptide repeat protein [Salinibacter grassmerensis]
MTTLLLGLLITLSPPADTASRDDCIDLLPVTKKSELPVSSFSDAQHVWAGREDISADTLQTYISQLQDARQCFQRLPEDARSTFRATLYTFKWEGYLRAALAQFSRVVEVLDDALAHLNKTSPPRDELEAFRAEERSKIYQKRGYLRHLLGNLSSALDQYLKALQNTPDDDTGLRMDLLRSVGVLYQHTQDYQSARYYFRRARRLNQKRTLSDSEERAELLHSQADLLLEKTLNTKFDRASIERAQMLARRSRAAAGPGTEQFAHASITLSESLGYLGKFDEAYRLNDEALQHTRTDGDVQQQALVLLKRGVLHMQTERWSQAETTLRRALSLAENLGDLDYQRRALRALGRLHELQSDWPMAEKYYREGVSVIEQYRESLTATQWSSTAFTQWRDTHRGLVRALLAQERPRAALAALDRTRARYLQDLRTQARLANELPTSTRARLDSIGRALSDVRTQLAKDTLSPPKETDLRTREATLMTARQKILGPALTTADRPSIDQVAASLGQQDRALVSYFLDAPWPVYDRPPRSAAFVLTADTLRTVALPGLTQDSVRHHVSSISPLFADQQASQGIGAMHFDLRPLRALHDRLYAPVAEHLPDGQPLTVIPDGPMFHVPFSMLTTAAPGGRYDHDRARFVLHERPTALDLSTSLAADTSETRGGTASFSSDLAAFGVSSFDGLRPPSSSLPPSRAGTTATSSLSLPPLPGVQSEINTLDRLFDDADTFLDERATETAFATASRQASVLHLASHALVNPSSSLQNAFLLHPDSSSDGLLFLHELQTRDRALPLAVLSGCSTARGTLRGGEGMAGLQYAFRVMGAQSTVSNLWPTADQSSVALMEHFYQNLRAGQPKDRALRRAKLTYLETHTGNVSPFFWAPTVLYGSPRSLQLGPGSSSFLWSWKPVALALLIALLAWSIVYARSRTGLTAS